MATPWPEELPCRAVMDGYDVELADNLVAFKTDVGPDITRLRSTFAGDVVQLRWAMTRQQVETFQEFYKVTLKSGSRAFSYTDEVSGTAVDYKFLPGQTPRITRAAPRLFYVSATLRQHG